MINNDIVKFYYNVLISKLDNFTIYNGTDVFNNGEDIKQFLGKYSEFIKDVFPKSTFIFSFTLNDNAPEEAYLELMQIYSDKYLNLSIVFLDKQSILDLYKMEKNSIDKYIDMCIEVLVEQGVLK